MKHLLGSILFLLASLLSSIKQGTDPWRIHFPFFFVTGLLTGLSQQEAENLPFFYWCHQQELFFFCGSSILGQLRCQLLPGTQSWISQLCLLLLSPQTVGKGNYLLLLISRFPHFSLVGFSVYSTSHVINTLH